MNDRAGGALFEALRLLELPAGVPAARAHRFPEGVGLLIRLLAGDEASLEQARREHPEAVEVLLDAAEFYLLQVCFTPGIDSYRVLGVNRSEPEERIREHYRLLVRWLHPDRNQDAWQNVYLDRVNQAWRDLRHAEDRARYDREVPETTDADAGQSLSAVPAFARETSQPPSLRTVSARTLRGLPRRALAAIGTAAALVLGWMVLDQPEQSATPWVPPEPALVSTSAVPTAEPKPGLGPQLRPNPGTESGRSDLVRADAADADSARTQIQSPALAQGARSKADPQPRDVARSETPSGVRAPAVNNTAAPPVDVGQARSDSTIAKRADTGQPQGSRSAIADRVPAKTAPTAPLAAEGEKESGESLASEGGATTTGANPPATQALAVEPAGDSGSTRLPVGPDQAPVQPPPERLDALAVLPLLEQFQSAYDAGDLIRLMALFTREARNRPKADGLLADGYRALFESSRARSLSLSHINWWQEAEGLAVVANFEATVTPLDSGHQHSSAGDIYFELRREGESVRIASVRHQEHSQ